MTTFNPAEHPRAATGAFVDKQQSLPETSLSADRTPGYPDARPVQATLYQERYDEVYKSFLEIGRVELDLRAIFDSIPLDEVPTENEPSDNDTWYEQAQLSGHAPEHDGPFTLNLNSADLRDYVDARKVAGQLAPIQTMLIPTPRRQHAIAGQAIREVYEGISVDVMLQSEPTAAKLEARRQAANSLRYLLGSSGVQFTDNSDVPKDQAVIDEILREPDELTAYGFLAASARIAHHLATRGEYEEPKGSSR